MKHLLIVEDEEELLNLYSLALVRDGYKVETAKSGQEAILKIKTSPPDLVILDIMLPVMNGYHVAQTILQDKTIAKKPKILFVTGRDTSKEKNLVEFLGASGVLEKPFTLDELKRTVYRITQGPSLE